MFLLPLLCPHTPFFSKSTLRTEGHHLIWATEGLCLCICMLPQTARCLCLLPSCLRFYDQQRREDAAPCSSQGIRPSQPPSLSQHLGFNHPFPLLEALPQQYPLHLFFSPSLPATVSSIITTVENLSLNLVTLLLVCSLFSGFPFQAD